MSEDLRRSAEIRNSKGLHARAAAKFCKTASAFDAEIRVKKGSNEVAGTSIMGLMMLAASIGTTIEITTRGRQAHEAMDALCKLVADKFDEE
jgi:phosphocarrier protein HPr